MSSNHTHRLPGRCFTVTYHGLIAEVRGAAQLVGDCECADCITLDPWDAARRAELRLLDGRRLVHVRWESFTCSECGG